MMLDQELGNRGEVVCNDAPADPTFHADFTMRQAAVQMPGASQLADATFDPIAEGLCGAKPGLVFVIATLVGFVTGLRQANALHAQGLARAARFRASECRDHQRLLRVVCRRGWQ